MIGFNALGGLGRLGNQMFQYAALKGIARNIGADITIPYYPDAVDDGIGNMLRTELFDSFDLNVNVGLLDSGQATTLHERHFHYDEELFYRCPDNVNRDRDSLRIKVRPIRIFILNFFENIIHIGSALYRPIRPTETRQARDRV